MIKINNLNTKNLPTSYPDYHSKKSNSSFGTGLKYILFVIINCLFFIDSVQAGNKLDKLEKQVNNWEKQVLAQNCESKCINGLGTYYISLGKIAKTEQVFSKITKDNPLEPMGWYYFGYALRKQKKMEAGDQSIYRL
ncbi:MAG: hypothetical protein ACQES9_11795 [Myxococcota bacterium]